MTDLLDDLEKDKTKLLLRQHFALFLKVFLTGFGVAAISGLPLVIWIYDQRVETLKEQAATLKEQVTLANPTARTRVAEPRAKASTYLVRPSADGVHDVDHALSGPDPFAPLVSVVEDCDSDRRTTLEGIIMILRVFLRPPVEIPCRFRLALNRYL